MRGRPLALSALMIVTTIAAGLTIRLAPLGLPNTLVKYGGSLMWALMIYWIVSTVRPLWTLMRGALVSSAIAFCVEIFKLYQTPLLDAFRLTLSGKLLLGRVFSLWDLVAYAVAIIVGVLADHMIRSTMQRLPRPERQDQPRWGPSGSADQQFRWIGKTMAGLVGLWSSKPLDR